MPAPRMTLSGRRLTEYLNRVAREWMTKKRGIGGKIALTPELVWVAYQEFGTATHFSPDGANLPASKSPEGYPIYPKNASIILLPKTPKWDQAKAVKHVGDPITEMHPGVEPKYFITAHKEELRQIAVDAFKEAVRLYGYNLEDINIVLLEEAMPKVKERIAELIDEVLFPADRLNEGAKLDFQAPGDVFRDLAQIVPATK